MIKFIIRTMSKFSKGIYKTSEDIEKFLNEQGIEYKNYNHAVCTNME